MKNQNDFSEEIRSPLPSLGRREFLVTGALAGMVLAAQARGMTGAGNGMRAGGLPVTELGRTGLKVTPISFGGILVTEPPVLERAIERGIRLIHISPEYQNGRSMEAVGRVMKTRRDKVVLALKTRPDRLDECLKTLNTDYVDILVPPLDTPSAISVPEVPESFERQKKSGKCGFLGFACHTDHVTRILGQACELGYFDVALLGYHFPMLKDPSAIRRNGQAKMKMLEEAIVRNTGSPDYNREFLEAVAKAAASGMGILAMKGLPKPQAGEPDSSNQVLIGSLCTSMVKRWHAHSVLASMGSFQAVDKYCGIMETGLGFIDTSLEERFWAGTNGHYCGACGNCRSACPAGIDIQSTLRYRMYWKDYGITDYARTRYRRLSIERRVLSCLDCGLCEQACSRGLPVRDMLKEAEGQLG